MAEIKLNEDTMSRILTQAIIDGIGEDEKNNIIGQAVAYLTQPGPSSYGRPAKTPLQEAFESAMQTYVHRVVRDHIEADEQVKATVDAAMGDLLGKHGDRLRNDSDLRAVVVDAIVDYFANKD